jgi:hypothetical protein
MDGAVIEHIGRKWLLFSHEGKVLGAHPSKRAAETQERAISISKARARGYRIPRPTHRRGARK